MNGGVRSRMTMRATIERNTAAGTDAWNQPAVPTWTPQEYQLPCLAWTTEAKDASPGREDMKVAGLERWRAMFPAGADLLDVDRIAQITDRQGVVIFSGPLLIVAPIEVKRTHIEVGLRRIA